MLEATIDIWDMTITDSQKLYFFMNQFPRTIDWSTKKLQTNESYYLKPCLLHI